jgi:hypothetical protein
MGLLYVDFLIILVVLTLDYLLQSMSKKMELLELNLDKQNKVYLSTILIYFILLIRG